ncbi:hypothetical protein ACJRO7_014087 [Eucalyptus globulus]|uniref:Uncharacterized protein n=1 Tax=Eucalyptus globulus TaxID=34317 RepID=A0ABD3L518_EUCGL
MKVTELGGSGRMIHQLPQVDARQVLRQLSMVIGHYHVITEVPGGHSIRPFLPHQLLHVQHRQRPVFTPSSTSIFPSSLFPPLLDLFHPSS